MNMIVSTAIASTAVPVTSPSVALAASDNVPAQLARLEQAVELLRTRYICEGWKIDEEGAERALRYFRAGCPDNEDQTEWVATMKFISSHGICWDWLMDGNVGGLICRAASRSEAALRNARPSDPIFPAIEEHGRAYAALSVEIVKTDDFEAAIPGNKRRTHRIDERVFETDDPRWLEHKRLLHDLHEAESDAECALASIVPTTAAGVCALLKYGAEVEERGCAWPDLYEDENAKWGRSWYYFVNRNIVECLEGLAS